MKWNLKPSAQRKVAKFLKWTAASLFLVFCASTFISNDALAHENDPHSVARPQEVRVEHISLDLRVDFAEKKISGKVTLRIKNLTGANKLYLDARNLNIQAVSVGVRQVPTTFRKGHGDPGLGEGLIVDIGRHTKTVTIEYETTEGADALQWLTPEQTAGKHFPFLFSQSQPIHARTWIPLQDTPEVRTTYDARITTDPDLLVLMSAENPQVKTTDGVYRFRMRHPIPSYLIAIAVGNLEFRAFPGSLRSGVYAEPETLDSAHWEFANTEKMIKVGEGLLGPYVWERFDLIVLPPAFPYGGMENPRLTFLTPTLLAGDRSLENVIAHELGHSWSGNLVTNSNGNHFWLNEGFTVYVERRILEAVSGQKTAEIQAQIGFERLLDELRTQPADLTKLRTNLRGIHPDDAYSEIPYEKGYLFLRHIEELVGRPRFDTFLRAYLSEFSFQSISTDDFQKFLEEKLILGDAELRRRINALEWIYAPGLPEVRPEIHSEALARMQRHAEAFAKAGRFSNPTILSFASVSAYEWVHFIRSLPKDTSLDRIKSLDKSLGFSDSQNVEILTEWLKFTIGAGYPPALVRAEQFLKSVGRWKFLEPIYRQLIANRHRELAVRIFNEAKSGYHSIVNQQFERLLSTSTESCNDAMGG